MKWSEIMVVMLIVAFMLAVCFRLSYDYGSKSSKSNIPVTVVNPLDEGWLIYSTNGVNVYKFLDSNNYIFLAVSSNGVALR